MGDFGAVDRHLSGLHLKDALLVPFHLQRSLRSRSALTAGGRWPPALRRSTRGQNGSRRFPAARAWPASGHVMVGGAHDDAAARPDRLEMKDAKTAVLKHDGGHFQFGLQVFTRDIGGV